MSLVRPVWLVREARNICRTRLRVVPTLVSRRSCASCPPPPDNLHPLLSSESQGVIAPHSSPGDTPHNDHRTLNGTLSLYSLSAYSPGSPLLTPQGSHLFFKLQEFLRAQYRAFGFQEVISPVIYKKSLWKRSGHWENYKDDMYAVVGRGARLYNVRLSDEGDKPDQKLGSFIPQEAYGLKPMNCPGHCLLYASSKHSYAELPIRYADFSPLHRNEASGTLSGLTRVRRFHQDDGHIFCTASQVESEIRSTLRFVKIVYAALGLGPIKLVLSTKPESHIGSAEAWAQAEKQLSDALDASGQAWTLNSGDGAFYGPKIDIILKDKAGKEHQTATIQLDFQLPRRFELEYTTAEGTSAPPIMIHRAVLGSLERFSALLIEHFSGDFPFWLSPRQVYISTLNTSEPVVAYAQSLYAELSGRSTDVLDVELRSIKDSDAHDFQCRLDDRATTLGAKIAQMKREMWSVGVTVGEKEVQDGTVSVDFEGLLKSRVVVAALENAKSMETVWSELLESLQSELGIMGQRSTNTRKGKVGRISLLRRELPVVLEWLSMRYF